MKPSERGFTLIELLVVTAIVALMAGAATMATFQVLNATERSNDHMTVIRQVQNAGYWISRDALMAENVITGNLTSQEFLTLTWTEWDYAQHSTYHLVTYSFQDLSDGIGKLKRTHQRTHHSAGPDEQALIAEYISYNTTSANYTNSVLTVQITASLGEAEETKEYTVWRRTNF